MPENFENVNHLVLNFYPDGYSLAVKLNEFPVFTSETILETAKISYEETSLLDYIENEELPPLLVDMIDSSPKLSKYKIWHNGCLILEVRDKINLKSDESNNSDNIFILLKPTNLSMLYDVLNLTGSNSWTDQDRLQLESQIVLHSSPPLYLEPDVSKLSGDFKSPYGCDSLSNDEDDASEANGLQSRLKKIYSSRTTYNRIDHNNGGNGNGNGNGSGIGNVRKVRSSDNIEHSQICNTVCPPPELTLQEFLANKRANKKALPIEQMPRFNRYRKHSK